VSGDGAWRGSSFPSTHWSSVSDAAGEASDGERQALNRLLVRYLPALKSHLVSCMKIAPDAAEDILQGFMSDKVLEQNLLAKADRERGKFRTFLLHALRNYAISAIRRGRAQKRTPDRAFSLDADEAWEPASAERDASAAFDAAWAREVLVDAMAKMKSECTEAGREDIWRVFEARVLAPALGDTPPMPYEELVTRFQFQSPVQASNVLVTAKRTFLRALRSVVKEYIQDAGLVDAEIGELKEILSSVGAGSALPLRMKE
jgi:DNA-directed RNA polymerase specialized sigma24 family protein